MADEATGVTPTGQEGPPPTGEMPVSGETPQGQPSGETPPTATGTGRSKEDEALIAELRSEAVTRRKNEKALETRLAELEGEKLSEDEKQKKRLAELEERDAFSARELQSLRLSLAVHNKAAELGIADPELALAALDRSKVEWDEEGETKNLDELLTDLLERKPILRSQHGPQAPKPANINAGEGQGNTPAPNLTEEELEAARELGMSPARYAAMKETTDINAYQELRRKEKSAQGG